jgi:hypothetical protein
MTKGKIIIRKERTKKGKGTSEEKQKEIVKQAILIKVIALGDWLKLGQDNICFEFSSCRIRRDLF